MDNFDENLKKFLEESPPPVVAQALLNISNWDSVQGEKRKQLKKEYDNLIKELHNRNNLFFYIIGLPQKLDDFLEVVKSDELKQEQIYFSNMADQIEKRIDRLKNFLDVKYNNQDIQGNIQAETTKAKIQERITKLKDFKSQYQKVARTFGAAITSKEKQLEMTRRGLVGARLKLIRQAEGLTQLDVANKIGVTKQAITGYESGRREPTIKILIELAKTLNISLDWLLDVPPPNYQKYEKYLQQ